MSIHYSSKGEKYGDALQHSNNTGYYLCDSQKVSQQNLQANVTDWQKRTECLVYKWPKYLLYTK